jgi:NADP-dependent 3-hydroxy acid dehydrogenase YdfG
VDTDFLAYRPVETPAETRAKALRPEDVAEAVLAVARLPESVVVPEMQILPTLL